MPRVSPLPPAQAMHTLPEFTGTFPCAGDPDLVERILATGSWLGHTGATRPPEGENRQDFPISLHVTCGSLRGVLAGTIRPQHEDGGRCWHVRLEGQRIGFCRGEVHERVTARDHHSVLVHWRGRLTPGGRLALVGPALWQDAIDQLIHAVRQAVEQCAQDSIRRAREARAAALRRRQHPAAAPSPPVRAPARLPRLRRFFRLLVRLVIVALLVLAALAILSVFLPPIAGSGAGTIDSCQTAGGVLEGQHHCGAGICPGPCSFPFRS